MGNQQSETQAEFNARPGLSEPVEFNGGPQPYNLQHHHNDGPSKVSTLFATCHRRTSLFIPQSKFINSMSNRKLCQLDLTQCIPYLPYGCRI